MKYTYKNLYRIIVVIIVSLKKSILCVIWSCPKINGEWLKSETNACIFNLMEPRFRFRAIATDNNATNVDTFTHLHKDV